MVSVQSVFIDQKVQMNDEDDFDDKDPDDGDEFDRSLEVKAVPPPFENAISKFERCFEFEYIVIHNRDYGNTGEIAVFRTNNPTKYSHRPLFRTKRPVDGCGTAVIQRISDLLNASIAEKLLIHHLLLTKVFPEPGPKLVYGVSSEQDRDLEKYGWTYREFQDPHSNWDNRRLSMWTADYNDIDRAMMRRKDLHLIPDYAFISAMWGWGIDHCEWDLGDYKENVRIVKSACTYTNGDAQNIEYVNRALTEYSINPAPKK